MSGELKAAAALRQQFRRGAVPIEESRDLRPARFPDLESEVAAVASDAANEIARDISRQLRCQPRAEGVFAGVHALQQDGSRTVSCGYEGSARVDVSRAFKAILANPEHVALLRDNDAARRKAAGHVSPYLRGRNLRVSSFDVTSVAGSLRLDAIVARTGLNLPDLANESLAVARQIVKPVVPELWSRFDRGENPFPETLQLSGPRGDRYSLQVARFDVSWFVKGGLSPTVARLLETDAAFREDVRSHVSVELFDDGFHPHDLTASTSGKHRAFAPAPGLKVELIVYDPSGALYGEPVG